MFYHFKKLGFYLVRLKIYNKYHAQSSFSQKCCIKAWLAGGVKFWPIFLLTYRGIIPRRVSRKSTKTWLPGYDTPASQAHWGIILRGVSLAGVSYPRESYNQMINQILPGSHTPASQSPQGMIIDTPGSQSPWLSMQPQRVTQDPWESTAIS